MPQAARRTVVGMDTLHRTRSRWAAVVAAVAVTLGAGGLGVVNATLDSGERTSFVPIDPCRMLDSRTGDDDVGPRSTPLSHPPTSMRRPR